MKNGLGITRLALALSFAMLALSAPSQAADYTMVANENNDWNYPAYSWKYVVDNADPGDGASCAASGYHWKTGYLNVFSLGAPFSGSASRSRWVTTCKEGNYVTYKLDISLNNCGFWVCDTNWKSTVVRSTGVNHEEKIVGVFTGQLEILLALR